MKPNEIPLLFFKAIPTPKQAMAGNYAKRKVKWRGLEIAIENEPGSIRYGYGKKGEVLWRTFVEYPYGYIKRTLGTDGDQVDCYLGPDLETAKYVYVMHQRQVGNFIDYDEDKCMIGFETRMGAIAGYLTHYNDPRFMGEISVLPVDEFVRRVKETPGIRRRLGRKLVAGPAPE